MNLAGILLLVSLALAFVAVAYAVSYHHLKETSSHVSGQRDQLLGVGMLLREILVEMRGIWGRENEGATGVGALMKEVAAVLPQIFKGLGPAAMRAGAHKHKLSSDDFAAAGQAEAFKRIEALVAEIGIEEISSHWRARRMVDLVAILRLGQTHLQKSAEKAQEAAISSPEENRVLRLLREKAGSKEIAAEVELQITQWAQATGREDPDAARGLVALRAVLEVLCHRRDQHRKALTLGVLLQTLGAGTEQLFRELEGSSGSDVPDGPRKALRAYVESLPGWDGRMPFNDVTRASHNANMSSVRRVLMLAA